MNGSVAYLVTTLGCLIGVAGVVVAVVARAQGPQGRPADGTARTRSATPTADALRGDPRRLKPGDIVEIRRVSYAVRGSVHLIEGGWSWAEHLLDTVEGDKRWLSVEEDPDLELVLWTAEPAATVTPGAPTLDFAGRRYASEESGQARFTATGSTGLDPTARSATTTTGRRAANGSPSRRTARPAGRSPGASSCTAPT